MSGFGSSSSANSEQNPGSTSDPNAGWNGAPVNLPAHYGKHLLPGEVVVAAERRHWARLIEPISSWVLGLVVALWLDDKLPSGVPLARDVIWFAWLGLGLRLGYKVFEWYTDWFVATNKRVILAYGVFTRRVAMMPLMKVTDMSYNRSVLGRLLGYGEFVLESAGQDQALRTVTFLPRPDSLYEDICMEIFPDTAPKPPPPPGGQPTDLTTVVQSDD